ncbi:GNAT family N-acetyltransferase [Streptomyces virginiae]
MAELDGRIVGHIGLSRSAAAAVVGRPFVAPAARGHRIGALLMERAVREARERAPHPVLDVVGSGTSAVALYERLGRERLATVEQRWSPEHTVTVHCYAAAG